MSYVKLEFPVLVQQKKIEGKPHYHLRPIFLPDTSLIHRRYDGALNAMENLVGRRLNGIELNRSNSAYLLWHLFNPELYFYTKKFYFKAGKDFFDGPLGIVTFELKGITFVCLPNLNHFIFIAKTHPKDKTDINERVGKVAAQILKDLKKEDPLIDLEDFYITKRAFITTIEKGVRVKSGQFHFERERFNFFFNSLNPGGDFDGGTEIEKVGKDLNQLYPNELLRAYYRDVLVERLTTSIYQNENTPIVLVGKEGVGKHSLLQEVAWRYISKLPNKDKNELPKIWLLDPTRVISGMIYVGWWEKRFESILEFIRTRRDRMFQPKVQDSIIFDNVVALLRIGKSAGSKLTLSDVLRPYIEKRQLQVILIATPEEWKVVQEKDRRFSDLFQVLRVDEPDLEDAVKMILAQRRILERAYECEISIQAVHFLMTVQRNYLQGKALPGSVIKLLRQIAVKYRSSVVELEHVRAEFKDFSGLQTEIFDTAYKFKREEVKKTIAAQLVGQEEAVEVLANVVHTVKAKLNNPRKPLASFLFIGPTGVGKTQAAKVLSQYLMGNEKQLIRFDMNEYIDAGAAHRLIGDYTNPEGQLTGKVRYNPFGVLLLDEIEKAHPSVHDLLLQVLDDGRLTDSVGRTVYFTNLIIIMTSNVGAKEVASQVGFSTTNSEDAAIFRKAVENKFRPEFVNRIDRIVIFNPLQYDHILNIARLQIQELLQRDGFVRRSTILNISQEALTWVAKRGFDARMGGRALKRQIEKDLTSLSAEQLIGSYTEQPILFDIEYKADRLIPKINILEVVKEIEKEWMPQLPEEKDGKKFYGGLLKRVKKIEDKIRLKGGQVAVIETGINDKSENWQYYYFTNRVAELKERMQFMVAGFKDHYFRGPVVNALRLKRIKNPLGLEARTDRAYTGMKKDQFFQQKAIDDLTEVARFAPFLFDKMEAQFINNYLDVIFLEATSKGFFAQRTDQLVIQITSVISGLGQSEIALLIEQYEAVFKAMDIPFVTDEKQQSIEIEGFGLYELFQGEAGIHLFHSMNQSKMPIKVTVLRKGKRPNTETLLKVVRFYKVGNILIDIRTGISNVMPIAPNEFKVFLYAGMVGERR